LLHPYFGDIVKKGTFAKPFCANLQALFFSIGVPKKFDSTACAFSRQDFMIPAKVRASNP